MKYSKISTLLMFIIILSLISGCSFSGKGNGTAKKGGVTVNGTTGQELTVLTKQECTSDNSDTTSIIDNSTSEKKQDNDIILTADNTASEKIQNNDRTLAAANSTSKKNENSDTTTTVNPTSKKNENNSNTPAVVNSTSEKNENNDKILVIADPTFEKIVRTAIKKPTGAIYKTDVNQLEKIEYTSSYTSAYTETIKNFNGIEYFANLKTLTINEVRIEDLSKLSSLKQLEKLQLMSDNISDITPLKYLTGLKKLNLGENNISNIEPLSELSGITFLILSSNKITDITSLKNMTHLFTIMFGDNYISDISTLSNFKNLLILDCSRNPNLSDFSVLKSLLNLQTLSADFLKKEDLEYIRPIPHLERLSFYYYNIIKKPEQNKLDISKYEELLDEADRVLSNIIKPGMTDYQKELAINDYIVNNVSYDYKTFEKNCNGTYNDAAYTGQSAYGALIEKKCVCTGFANAMCLLLNKANIECFYLGSRQEDHAWNIVKLDNEYYHVDTSREVTKGDKHKYFNLTDKQISVDHAWDKERFPICNGTKYKYNNAD